MNRRSFITKALAGLAVVPLLSRVPQTPRSDYNKPVRVALGPIKQIDRIWFGDTLIYRAEDYDEAAGVWHPTQPSDSSSSTTV